MAKQNRKKLRALYHYAAEHEGRKQSVRIGKALIHTVECGPTGSLMSGERRLAGYWIRLTNADGRWTRVEFRLDGELLSERYGNALEAD